jgi:hypothetical protein
VDLIALFSNPSVNPRFERFLQIESTFLTEETRPASTPKARQAQHRLSATQLKQLVTDYQLGVSINDLCDKYEVHRTTVMGHAKRAGLSRKPRPRS